MPAQDRFALHVAARSNRLDAIRLLVSKGAAINLRDPLVRVARSRAFARDVVKFVVLWLQNGMTALHEAVVENREEAVQLLLELGASAHVEDSVLHPVLCVCGQVSRACV